MDRFRKFRDDAVNFPVNDVECRGFESFQLKFFQIDPFSDAVLLGIRGFAKQFVKFLSSRFSGNDTVEGGRFYRNDVNCLCLTGRALSAGFGLGCRRTTPLLA